ncbi:MT-A70 family methyltransferase [Bradyrhizobium sp. BR 1433]|uniref:MT-A70 family methyltransferase n=1 Tax=Bradyrhizobium sp. BR 1433 TaxID=3447967 RepID=UPI003EE468AB
MREQIDLVEVDGAMQILDGRNRYRALVWIATKGDPLGEGWQEHFAGGVLTPADLANLDDIWLYQEVVPDYYDGDLLGYVLSKNLNRRHLTDDQRRVVAAKLVNLRQGRPAEDKTSQIANISRDQAAEIMSTDVAGIDRARSVLSRAAPEIVEAVEQGAVSVAAAAEIAAQPAERQAAIVAQLPRDAEGKLTPEVKKALAPIVKEMRAEKVAAKKERRAEREQDLGRKLQALPDKMFGVAIEDFEWHHEVWSPETGMNKHPANYYETAADATTPEQIVDRCAERFACLADDCILFKWTTQPHLAVALRALELQGFRYVTNLVWNKERPGEARGHGYWFTGEHEICLVGVRGKVVPPATAHFRSNFSAPVGDHSEKPLNIHEIIEFHWPNTPKVEFNARRARPGWTCWGFDAPASSSSTRVGLASLIAAGEAAERGDAVDGSDQGSPEGYDPAGVEATAEAAPSHGGAASTISNDIRQRDWEGLWAVAWLKPIDQAVAADMIARGLIFQTRPGDMSAGYTPTKAGRERVEQLQGLFDLEETRRKLLGLASQTKIANGGGATPAAEPPAPSADVAPAERGKVVSDAAAPAACADTAVSPVNRPGANSDDGLDIPAFLRRAPVAQTEMDLARIDRAPAEVVDDRLQTRMPLTDDEVELRSALLAIDAGTECPWSIMRQAIGAGYAHATTTKIMVTDEGRAFLAQLAGPAPAEIEARA